MKEVSKSWRTTAVAFIGLVCALFIIVLVFLDKITMQDAALGLASVATFLGVINGILGKDAKATHSKSSIVGPRPGDRNRTTTTEEVEIVGPRPGDRG